MKWAIASGGGRKGVRRRLRREASERWLVRWIPFALGFLLFLGVGVSVILHNYGQTEKLYLSSQTEAFQNKLDTTMIAYQRFSNYVFKNHVNLPEIHSLMKRAVVADESGREMLREQLQFALQGTHQTIQEYDFRQLHFHLPNGDSFLRFHAPDLHGDNLFGVRASVRMVNESRRPVSGFEEGRVYNGYRFVYPLFDQMTHVGSVEVSVSMTAVIRSLMEQYGDMDVFFAMDRQVVEAVVFDSQQANYQTSVVAADLLADREVEAYTNANLRNLSVAEYKELFASQRVNFQAASLTGRTGHAVSFQGRNWVLEVLPLQNLEKKQVGLLVAVQPDTLTLELGKTRNRELLILAMFTLLGLAASMMIQRSQIKLAALARTDLLTGLYNRKEFQSRADEEWARAERHGRVFSLLLFDIDHFKRVNDRHGHAAGDEVLREVARVMRTVARRSDVMFRWGGEEFLVLLPETDGYAATQAAEKFRSAIAGGVQVKGEAVTVHGSRMKESLAAGDR